MYSLRSRLNIRILRGITDKTSTLWRSAIVWIMRIHRCANDKFARYQANLPYIQSILISGCASVPGHNHSAMKDTYMSAALHLAKPADLPRLQSLVAAFHAQEGVTQTDEDRAAALTPLLEGTPHGAAYLIGPKNGPVGYIVISFGYSVEMGGIKGFIDEFYIRENVRGRGMGGEVLRTLMPALADNGIKALHLEVGRDNEGAKRLYARLGFAPRDCHHLMTRRF